MSSSSFSIVRHHRDGSLVLVSLFRQYIYLSIYLSFYLFLVRLSIIVPFLFIFCLKPTTPTDTDTDNHIQKTNPLSASSLSGEQILAFFYREIFSRLRSTLSFLPLSSCLVLLFFPPISHWQSPDRKSLTSPLRHRWAEPKSQMKARRGRPSADY